MRRQATAWFALFFASFRATLQPDHTPPQVRPSGPDLKDLQAQTMVPATPQRTAEARRVEPTPTIDPVTKPLKPALASTAPTMRPIRACEELLGMP
jgi:hypothetical protein